MMKKPFSKISDAFWAGYEGKTPPEDTGRIGRVAHALGASSLRQHKMAAEAFDQRERDILAGAIEAAQGPARTALEIVRNLIALPQDGTFVPAARSVTQMPEGPAFTWLIDMHYGKNINPHANHSIPLAQPLGTLILKDPEGVQPHLTTSVHCISITPRWPVDKHDNPIAPPYVEIDMNLPTHYTEMSPTGEFTGGVTVTIGGDGLPIELGLARTNQSGYTPTSLEERVPEIGILLESVHESVRATQALYDGLPGNNQ
jgi:hypothetical protein